MKKFYVIGNPISHSLSPKIFKIFFNILNIHASYMPMLIEDDQELKLFLNKLKNDSDFIGANITLPFKKSIMNYLDIVDHKMTNTKSINCIKKINSQLVGYNTDSHGFDKLVSINNINYLNENILILGNGGTAYTICDILKNKANVYVWGRNENNIKSLISHYRNVKQYDKNKNLRYVVINCLPLNLNENSTNKVLSYINLSKVDFFIDINYIETILFKHFKNNNCKAILGHDMFIYQAIESLNMWLGQKTSEKICYKKVKKIFKK